MVNLALGYRSCGARDFPKQKPLELLRMWGDSLSLVVGLLCFALTLYFFYPSEQKQCMITLTGESIRIAGCELRPEHIEAIAKLKVLSAPLGEQA